MKRKNGDIALHQMGGSGTLLPGEIVSAALAVPGTTSLSALSSSLNNMVKTWFIIMTIFQSVWQMPQLYHAESPFWLKNTMTKQQEQKQKTTTEKKISFPNL